MQQRAIIVFVLLGLASMGFSQPLSIPSIPPHSSDTTVLNAKIDGSSYFYNYEYFKPFAKGLTQPGFALEPKLEANFGSRLLLGGGVHMQKYWGTEPFAQTEPILFARYEAAKNFYVQIGALENKDGHMLSRILYNPLNTIEFKQENGLQLRYYGNAVYAEAWVNWMHYLEEGADDQEKLTAGFVVNWRVTSSDSPFELMVPVQAVFMHFGGQINDKTDPNKKVRTLNNHSFGLQAAYRYSETGKAGILVQPLRFNDSYDKIPEGADDGNYALSATLFMENRDLTINGNYMHSKNFYTILGDRIYNSMTINYDSLKTERNLFSAEATYNKQIYPGINFRIDAGAFYDPSFSDIDYYYGTTIVFRIDAWTKRTNYKPTQSLQ